MENDAYLYSAATARNLHQRRLWVRTDGTNVQLNLKERPWDGTPSILNVCEEIPKINIKTKKKKNEEEE